MEDGSLTSVLLSLIDKRGAYKSPFFVHEIAPSVVGCRISLDKQVDIKAGRELLIVCFPLPGSHLSSKNG